jgi:hypothetical protein
LAQGKKVETTALRFRRSRLLPVPGLDPAKRQA